MLAGHQLQRLIYRFAPDTIVPRHSSDVLAVPDDGVAAAMACIHRSYASPLTVPAILKQVPAFRRDLEWWFQRAPGRTIMQEVRRVRIEQAKHLPTTRLPTTEIASRVGLANAKRLALALSLRSTADGSVYGSGGGRGGDRPARSPARLASPVWIIHIYGWSCAWWGARKVIDSWSINADRAGLPHELFGFSTVIGATSMCC
jgi:AraC-like DNA-binding protein